MTIHEMKEKWKKYNDNNFELFKNSPDYEKSKHWVSNFLAHGWTLTKTDQGFVVHGTSAYGYRTNTKKDYDKDSRVSPPPICASCVLHGYNGHKGSGNCQKHLKTTCSIDTCDDFKSAKPRT